jgi:hypothetical protein
MVCIELIWSLLTDRKFYVTVARERFAECDVPSGVPKGAVLSPTLFNIFTSEFLTLTDVWPSLLMPRHYLVHMPKQMCLLIGLSQP